MASRTVLQVAVPAPLRSTFDYLPPAGCDPSELRPGIRVLAPFGRRRVCGLLLGVRTASEMPDERLKRIHGLLDSEPLLSAADLELLSWAARYYRHPPGEVLIAALPGRLRRGGRERGLRRTGWRLTPLGARQDPAGLPRAPRQRELLTLLQQHPGGLVREQIELRHRAALRALERKGWVGSWDRMPEPGGAPSTAAPGPLLNPGQRRSVDAVARRLDAFGAFLLDGVTGSGKTEVYIELAARVIERRRQVLLLVPEIGLTPQLLDRFRCRISVPIAVLHSGLTDRQREDSWHQARSGVARLVIGTRSAIFTPLPDLGLLVVDEEHDLSFKQQEGFRYSARDLAVVRAQRTACPVLMGSATPSLESLRNAWEGRYRLLTLSQRAGGARPPRLDLLDIRARPAEAGVAPALMGLMESALEAGDQVLLFLNRRGYAPVLICPQCGWVAQCGRCDARLTLHLAQRLLWCHHCGSRNALPGACPECASASLTPVGQGTQRLQRFLEERFPRYPVVRIDRDATRGRGALQARLAEIRDGRYSLLLGTQMLAKGHHFPGVTLVGILDLDQGLFGADFRSAERTAQLIVQVAGRAGRAEKAGRVIIQTRHPDHPLLQRLLHQGYRAFAGDARRERREAGLPPYSHQALLRAEAHRREDPVRFLAQAASLAGDLTACGVELWGPVPAPMERKAGRVRAHLLVQAVRRAPLQALLDRWVPLVQALKSARRVRWSIDVDPQELL